MGDIDLISKEWFETNSQHCIEGELKSKTNINALIGDDLYTDGILYANDPNYPEGILFTKYKYASYTNYFYQFIINKDNIYYRESIGSDENPNISGDFKSLIKYKSDINIYIDTYFPDNNSPFIDEMNESFYNQIKDSIELLPVNTNTNAFVLNRIIKIITPNYNDSNEYLSYNINDIIIRKNNNEYIIIGKLAHAITSDTEYIFDTILIQKGNDKNGNPTTHIEIGTYGDVV